MIEICPFVASVPNSEKTIDLYAVIRDKTVVFYQLNNKGQAEIVKTKFEVAGFYIQEAKDMWQEKIKPLLGID